MKLEGIHHVSSITGDAQANVDFYSGVLGLRLVKKTVNQDNPTVYHLFYGDDNCSPGFDLTFFEYPGARPGRAGEGMIHRIVLRVASDEALDFWKERLGSGERSPQSLVFSDPEGLGLELRVVRTPDAPLTASHPEIPAEYAIQGFEEVRAYSNHPEASRELLEGALEFEREGGSSWQARGDSRGGRYVYDPSCSRAHSSSSGKAAVRGRLEATVAAGATSMIRPLPSEEFPVQEPSTTSRGPRWTTSRWGGGIA